MISISRYSWRRRQKAGLAEPVHRSGEALPSDDEENRNQYATELCPDIRIREEKIDGAIRTVLDALDETASAHVLAAFDGTDFTSPLPQIPEVIRLINQRMEGELELVHSTPAAYFEAVKGGH